MGCWMVCRAVVAIIRFDNILFVPDAVGSVAESFDAIGTSGVFNVYRSLLK